MPRLPDWALFPMLISSLIGVLFLGAEFCRRYVR